MSKSDKSEASADFTPSNFLKAKKLRKNQKFNDNSFDWQEIRANLLNSEKSSVMPSRFQGSDQGDFDDPWERKAQHQFSIPFQGYARNSAAKEATISRFPAQIKISVESGGPAEKGSEKTALSVPITDPVLSASRIQRTRSHLICKPKATT